MPNFVRNFSTAPAEDAFEYVSKKFLVREVAYPNKGTASVCQSSNATKEGAISVLRFPGYDIIPATPRNLMGAVYRGRAPVVYFTVGESFVGYSNGKTCAHQHCTIQPCS